VSTPSTPVLIGVHPRDGELLSANLGTALVSRL